LQYKQIPKRFQYKYKRKKYIFWLKKESRGENCAKRRKNSLPLVTEKSYEYLNNCREKQKFYKIRILYHTKSQKFVLFMQTKIVFCADNC